jgi:ribose 5-phosphate isomerase B
MDSTIAIASDHGGFELKEDLKTFLAQRGHRVVDFGTQGESPVDYPVIGARVAEEISSGRITRGILVCGTGIGMSIVANRFPGVRAALCHDLYTAEMSRRHNDANCLVLGGRVLGKGLAREMVRVWLETPFEWGRHRDRLLQIQEMEQRFCPKRGK